MIKVTTIKTKQDLKQRVYILPCMVGYHPSLEGICEMKGLNIDCVRSSIEAYMGHTPHIVGSMFGPTAMWNTKDKHKHSQLKTIFTMHLSTTVIDSGGEKCGWNSISEIDWINILLAPYGKSYEGEGAVADSELYAYLDPEDLTLQHIVPSVYKYTRQSKREVKQQIADYNAIHHYPGRVTGARNW